MKLEKEELLIIKDAMGEYINAFEYSFTPDGWQKVRDVFDKINHYVVACEIGVKKVVVFNLDGSVKE